MVSEFFIEIDGTPISRPAPLKPELPLTNPKPDRCIALVDSRTFMRECMRRGMQAAFSLPVVTFSTPSELETQFNDSIALVFLCLADARREECIKVLKLLAALDPSVPIVVHATGNDVELATTAINLGAKGYISSATSFEVAIEAVRFILAGGTYVPVNCLFASAPASVPATQPSLPPQVLTGREVSIVKAVQQGKSNKIIAYKLCICEGTVKVHLRNIMKKLKARNRTDVAIKAQMLLGMNIEPAAARL